MMTQNKQTLVNRSIIERVRLLMWKVTLCWFWVITIIACNCDLWLYIYIYIYIYMFYVDNGCCSYKFFFYRFYLEFMIQHVNFIIYDINHNNLIYLSCTKEWIYSPGSLGKVIDNGLVQSINHFIIWCSASITKSLTHRHFLWLILSVLFSILLSSLYKIYIQYNLS